MIAKTKRKKKRKKKMAVKQLDQISSENQNVDINTILTLIHTYRQENGFNRVNLIQLYENFVYILSKFYFFLNFK